MVYIEPYRKSLVQELYPDSVIVDPADQCADKVRIEPFVGVAPRRYSDLFDLATMKRKSKDGSGLYWNRSEAVPRLPEYMSNRWRDWQLNRKRSASFLASLLTKALLNQKERISDIFQGLD